MSRPREIRGGGGKKYDVFFFAGLGREQEQLAQGSVCVRFHDCSSLADAKQHLSFRFEPAHLLKLLNRVRGVSWQGKKGM